MTRDELDQAIAIRIRKYRESLQCNCGGPEYGTGHSPDCEFELGLEYLSDEIKQMKYDFEQEQNDCA